MSNVDTWCFSKADSTNVARISLTSDWLVGLGDGSGYPPE